MKPNVSIVIVNWNTRDLLINCLASIRDDAAVAVYEVVVVDNGSTDGSAAAVQAVYPDLKLIIRAENQGYAYANMIGFRATSREYVLFLNSDTVVPPGAINSLVEHLESNALVGACGPRLLRPDGKIQPFAFGCDPKLSYLLARACVRIGFRAPLHDWDTSVIQAVDWVSGACLLVRRSAFAQVGGFDERIFMYFEDSDLCLRMRRAGWQVVFNPLVAVTHVGGASLADSAYRKENYYKSLRYFYSKHYSPLECLALRVLLPLYSRYFD